MMGSAVDDPERHWQLDFGAMQHGRHEAIPTYKCSINCSMLSSMGIGRILIAT
jgi:hypothetical protein